MSNIPQSTIVQSHVPEKRKDILVSPYLLICWSQVTSILSSMCVCPSAYLSVCHDENNVSCGIVITIHIANNLNS